MPHQAPIQTNPGESKTQLPTASRIRSLSAGMLGLVTLRRNVTTLQAWHRLVAIRWRVETAAAHAP
jgi:hypothetical protein